MGEIVAMCVYIAGEPPIYCAVPPKHSQTASLLDLLSAADRFLNKYQGGVDEII